MSITFDKETRMFFLDGKNVTYCFFINYADYAEHLYFGKKIPHEDIRYTRAFGAHSANASVPGCDACDDILKSFDCFGAELSFFGTGDYREPAVLVENKTGDRISDLLYNGYEILDEKPAISGMPSMKGGETLVLHLKDRLTDFGADLYYTVYPDADVIARRIVYKNGGNAEAVLRRAYSFSFGLPAGEYDMVSFFGAWAKERTPERLPLRHGVSSVDSKRCTSSHVLNPFIAVADRSATETSGEVYGFSLVYSSSYVLKSEIATSGEIQITGGINDFGFSWKLNPGESLETPEIVIAYSSEGFGAMSRAYHDAFRNYLINPRYVRAHRPLLINNWEGTYFDFDNETLMSIIDAASGTGIDTFVLDDGWFGKRDDDFSGLGDWVVNENKLKGGLKTIINHAHEKGLKFGLWFEPEMINEDSDLYRAHPDYAIQVPGRKHSLSRHQMVLDLTRGDVRDYIVGAVNKVLKENEIDYVKWDCNRNVTDAFSLGLEPERQGELAHRYALGLYDICERIVNANPEVFFEGCSGGGMRFDPAMLYYFPQIWTSDDSDAEERTKIQYGTSFVYPVSSMSCHVSVCPNHQTGRTTPFGTRANIAHLGATGYELDMAKLSSEELEEVKKQIKEYNSCADLILNGDLYRIDDPFSSNYFAFGIVSKDKKEAFLTAYRRMHATNGEAKRICMQGLDENKKYYVPELKNAFSGATLMNVGIPMNFEPGDFMSLKYHFKEV